MNDGGLAGLPDRLAFDAAVAQARIVVTENVADFAALVVEQAVRNGETSVPVVFLRKADLPRCGALAVHLAERLARWADANPEPYLGPHWP